MNNSSVLVRELAAGRTVMSFTEGDSMEPLLHQGESCVVIAPVQRALRPGDLPLYQRPTGQLVLHRIVGRRKGLYLTRGDNRCGREQVPADWIIGIATEIHRSGRTIRVTDLRYRLYVQLWMLLYPVRFLYLHLQRRCRR